MLVKEYRSGLCLGMGLAYRSKQLAFDCLELNLRRGWKMGVRGRGGMNNLFGQKGF